MKLNFKILAICLIGHSSLCYSSFITIEGLARNNPNEDHEIKLFALKATLLSEKDAGEQVDIFMQEGSGGIVPFFVRKKDADKATGFNLELARDFYTKGAEKSIDQKIFFSAIHSLLFTRGDWVLALLRTSCGGYTSQTTTINEEKKELLINLRELLKKGKLKEDQIWTKLNNGNIAQTQKVLNEPIYLTDQGVKYVFNAGTFHHQIDLKSCTLSYSVDNLELESIAYQGSSVRTVVSFSDYVAYAGAYYFPGRISVDGASHWTLKVDDLLPIKEMPSWTAKNASDANKEVLVFP